MDDMHKVEFGDLFDPRSLECSPLQIDAISSLLGAGHSKESRRGSLIRIRTIKGLLEPLMGVHPAPEMTPVDGGRIEMGIDIDEVDEVIAKWRHVGVERTWILKEAPRHELVLDSYKLAIHPVTNEQYLCFLAATGYPERPSTWYLGAFPWDRGTHPVAGISSDAADRYIEWLAGDQKINYRLPTEAEWEHAAKGFDNREYPWGNTFDPDKCNTRETGFHTTSPVGSFPEGDSVFGLQDMAGNVEEFVSSEYKPYPGGEIAHDDLTLTGPNYRVTRGGSFARFGDLARTTRRHGPFPSALYPCGLRVAL